MTYRKRRLLGRFVLTVKNFATSNVNQKQSNGECLMGMFKVRMRNFLLSPSKSLNFIKFGVESIALLDKKDFLLKVVKNI